MRLVRFFMALAFGLAVFVELVGAIEGEFEQSISQALTHSPSDEAASLERKSALKLVLPDLTLSGSLDFLEEFHSAKQTLSRHQQLINLKLLLDGLNLESTLEHLRVSFPKAPEKDKTTLAFQTTTALTLEALTLKGDLSLENRDFPNKTSKNELLSGVDLTGHWETDLWELSVSFQGDERRFPNEAKSDQRSGELKTGFSLSLGAWKGAAGLSQGILTFPNDPQRDENDFDRSLQLAGKLSLLSVAFSASLSDVIRPLDLSQEKRFSRLTAELARELLGWQLGLQLTDEETRFPQSAKKAKVVQKRQFTAKRDFGTLVLHAIFKDEATSLPNDPAKDTRFSDRELQMIWSLAQTALTVTLDEERTRFPNVPVNDFNHERFAVKLDVILLADLETTLLGQLERTIFSATPLKDELTTTLELSLGVGF